MSEEERISIDQAGMPVDWGNGDDDRGLGNDLVDVGRDFGSDMEWTGESIGNTWETAGDKMESDTDNAISGAKTDWDSGDYFGAAGDIGLGLVYDTSDVVAGAIGTVADGLSGIGAASVAAAHDVYDVASDVGSDVVSGAESVADDIGDGVEDAIDDIGDLF
jgi:hypothetical protein